MFSFLFLTPFLTVLFLNFSLIYFLVLYISLPSNNRAKSQGTYMLEMDDIVKDTHQELELDDFEKSEELGQVGQNDRCEKELELVKDQLARLTADFQNYKKRVDKDRLSWIDRSHCEVLLPLLEVVDNFDRAFEDAKKANEHEQGALREHIKGFELIHKMFYSYLTTQKVTAIEQMSTFDPHIHEAVVQVDVPDYRSGDVVTVFQKGFMYKETILRTAKVSVAK